MRVLKGHRNKCREDTQVTNDQGLSFGSLESDSTQIHQKLSGLRGWQIKIGLTTKFDSGVVQHARSTSERKPYANGVIWWGTTLISGLKKTKQKKTRTPVHNKTIETDEWCVEQIEMSRLLVMKA